MYFVDFNLALFLSILSATSYLKNLHEGKHALKLSGSVTMAYFVCFAGWTKASTPEVNGGHGDCEEAAEHGAVLQVEGAPAGAGEGSGGEKQGSGGVLESAG